MTSIVAAIIGSGTLPYTRGILPPDQRGNQTGAEGVRTGTQVMIGNPEDILAVDAFATSGVSIGVTPVLVWGPSINPLPRQRSVTIHNQGPSTVFLGANSTAAIGPSGIFLDNGNTNLATADEITLPFLKNVEIWASAPAAGGAQLSIWAW